MPIPEWYSDEVGSCASSLLQCSLVFDLQSLTYLSDRSGIAFVVNLLSRRAAQRATAVLENQTPASSSFQAFTAELQQVFDHSVQSGEAASQMLSLRQDSSSVMDYSIRFRILVARSGWNDVALQGVLTQGLAEVLMDELATQEESGELETLISLVIQLDNRLQDRCWQRDGEYPVRSLGSLSWRSGAPVDWSTSVAGEPMQVGLPNSSARKRWRSAKVCLYCGQAGHFLADCPFQPNELGPSTCVGVLVSASSSCSTLARLTLPCTLLLRCRRRLHQQGLGDARPHPRRDSVQVKTHPWFQRGSPGNGDTPDPTPHPHHLREPSGANLPIPYPSILFPGGSWGSSAGHILQID